MHIRFLRCWCRGAFRYDEGRELTDFHDGMAEMLIRRGIAEKVETVETAALEQPKRNAMHDRVASRKPRETANAD